jgi:hypothetical protein
MYVLCLSSVCLHPQRDIIVKGALPLRTLFFMDSSPLLLLLLLLLRLSTAH